MTEWGLGGVCRQTQRDPVWATPNTMIKNTHQQSTVHTVHNIYLHQDGNLEVISPSSIHTTREYYLSPPHLWERTKGGRREYEKGKTPEEKKKDEEFTKFGLHLSAHDSRLWSQERAKEAFLLS